MPALDIPNVGARKLPSVVRWRRVIPTMRTLLAAVWFAAALSVPLACRRTEHDADASAETRDSGVDPKCAAGLPMFATKGASILGVAASAKPVNEAFHLVDGSPSPRGASSSAPIELRLDMATTKSAGEPLAPRATVANTSHATVSIFAPFGGSHANGRYPYWYVYARDESTQNVYRWGDRGLPCGNSTPPLERDHVVIEPGDQTIPNPGNWPSELDRAALPAPGTYTVWVEYAFCGYGDSKLVSGATELRKDVVAGRFASNGVTVTVK